MLRSTTWRCTVQRFPRHLELGTSGRSRGQTATNKSSLPRDSQPVQIKHLGMTWWYLVMYVVPLHLHTWNLPKQRRDGAWWSCTRQPAWTSTHKLYVRRWEWRTCALVPRFWMFKESQNHVYHYCIFRLHKQLQLCGQKISKISSALQMLFSHMCFRAHMKPWISA